MKKILIGIFILLMVIGSIGIYIGFANWHQNNYDFYTWKAETKYAYVFVNIIYLFLIQLIREKFYLEN